MHLLLTCNVLHALKTSEIQTSETLGAWPKRVQPELTLLIPDPWRLCRGSWSLAGLTRPPGPWGRTMC